MRTFLQISYIHFWRAGMLFFEGSEDFKHSSRYHAAITVVSRCAINLPIPSHISS